MVFYQTANICLKIEDYIAEFHMFVILSELLFNSVYNGIKDLPNSFSLMARINTVGAIHLI